MHRANLSARRGACPDVPGLNVALLGDVLAEIASVYRDSYSLLVHSRGVGAAAWRLATALGLDRRTCALAFVSGLFHDAGKTRTRPDTLFKRGALTAVEREHLRQHPLDGFSLLRDFDDRRVLEAVLHHHEAPDGSGYPCGLRGDQIPLLARVVGVADFYVALREDRPYRPAFDHATTLAMLSWSAESGKLDAAVARLMIRLAAHRDGGAANTIRGRLDVLHLPGSAVIVS